MRYLAGLAGILIAGFTAPAWAAQAANVPASAVAVGELGEVLVVFLVLAVIFEVALTPVFNWRWFLIWCEGRGYKVPITFGLALYIFWSYDLDIVRDVLVALGHPANFSFTGQVLTALLIAGGSDGVFRIFTKLGIRNPLERAKKAKEARAEVAKKKK